MCELPSINFTNICLISSKRLSSFSGLTFMLKQAQAKTEQKVIMAKKLSFPNSVTILAGTILMKIPVLRLSEIEISVKEEAPVVANCLLTSVKRNLEVISAVVEHESEPSAAVDMNPPEPELQPDDNCDVHSDKLQIRGKKSILYM
jgi:hypothetical protein